MRNLFKPFFAFGSALALVAGLMLFASAPAERALAATPADGVVKVASQYDMAETVARLQADIADKGILLFDVIDQSKLAAEAGIALRPSVLLIFGNPGLGSHFITAKAEAGLDWPVRLLVTQDDQGQVWAVYTDFAYIAQRHEIANREAEFAMASEVIGSITSSVAQ
jgi:uncharacterized protein (DUF302 family)